MRWSELKRHLAIFSVLATASCLLFWGCDKEYIPLSAPEYTDYGSGVLYFPYQGESFGRALADFLKKNDSYRVVTIAPDDTAPYGTTRGYFVLVVQPCCPTLLRHDLK